MMKAPTLQLPITKTVAISQTIVWVVTKSYLFESLSYTAKNILIFYGKITGNQSPVHFPFLRAPVNIFRNQSQYSCKKTCIAFGYIALKP